MGILGKRKADRALWRRKKRARISAPAPARLSRNMVRPNSMVHSFKRMTPITTIVGAAPLAPYQNNTNVALSNLLNYTEFTNLFDQFRINYVVIKFWLRIDPSAQTAATASYPKLYWVRDYNSATLLTQNEMRERANCRISVMSPNKPVVIKFKPNLLNQQTYTTVGTSSYTPIWNQWIDRGSAAAFYYGGLYNIDDLTNTNYKVDIETTYYFQCKNTL